MSQPPRASRKTNQKSTARKANGEASQHDSHTKENPVNPAMTTTPMSSRRRPFGEVTIEANTDNASAEDVPQKMLEMQAALEKAEADKKALIQQLANATSNVNPDDGQAGEVDEVLTRIGKNKKSVIPRPSGNFNIRDAMGLSRSEKKRNKYSAILRVVRELAGNARLNWELEWAKIPVRDKAQFFQAVRESIPDMARYANDWATEMIVRQWMKNKRSYAVQKGFINVEPKWEYLKENAAKRSNAPRGNGKRKAKSQCSSGPAPKKAKTSAKTSAKGKGKARATVVHDDDDDDSDEEDEDEEMRPGGKEGDGNEEEDDSDSDD